MIHQCYVPQNVMLACAIGVYEMILSSSQINICGSYTLILISIINLLVYHTKHDMFFK